MGVRDEKFWTKMHILGGDFAVEVRAGSKKMFWKQNSTETRVIVKRFL